MHQDSRQQQRRRRSPPAPVRAAQHQAQCQQQQKMPAQVDMSHAEQQRRPASRQRPGCRAWRQPQPQPSRRIGGRDGLQHQAGRQPSPQQVDRRPAGQRHPQLGDQRRQRVAVRQRDGHAVGPEQGFGPQQRPAPRVGLERQVPGQGLRLVPERRLPARPGTQDGVRRQHRQRRGDADQKGQNVCCGALRGHGRGYAMPGHCASLARQPSKRLVLAAPDSYCAHSQYILRCFRRVALAGRLFWFGPT